MTYPNWFKHGDVEENFQFFLEGMKDVPVQMLQIGAFTGDASLWLFKNILTNPSACLVDVDTWQGSDEAVHDEFDWADVERTYDEKVKPYDRKSVKVKSTSGEFFESNWQKKFDFIYVDGSHTAFDVFNDGINAFDCLAEGGILAFDDYTWDSGKGDFFNPRDGVDGVYITYMNDLHILTAGTQVWFQKITKPKMLIEETHG